ncbi:MAG: hypothetical protein [Caudoviricetes sp.]|nr:MAG: hypothetical protein [Caudoviricetes sp.]
MELTYNGSKSKIPEIWNRGEGRRSPFLSRAELYVKWTLPYLIQEATEDVSSQNGWTSEGAEGVNFLANKLAQVLFPAQRSFFRFDTTAKGTAALLKEGNDPTQLQSLFADIEKNAMSYGEKVEFRPAAVEAFKHLQVTGNVLLFKPAGDKAIQAIGLRNYVVERDTSGTILDIVLLQEKALETFPPAMQMAIQSSMKGKQYGKRDTVCLYTHAKRDGDGFYVINQSANDIPVGVESRVSEDRLPFRVLTWKRSYGEDYGRGYIEDYAGLFFVINFLSEAVTRGMALMADVKYLLRAGSTVDIDTFVNGGSGAVMYGQEGDVHIVQLGKYADYTPIQNVLEVMRQKVGRIFMMETLTRRDAERVTAYEIQRDALSIEQSLGGVYSMFAVTFQKPMAMWFLQGVGSGLTSDKVEPVIITGIEALGRMAELEKLATFHEYAALPLQWPEPLQRATDFVKYKDWVSGQISAHFPFFYTQEEMQQQDAAAQQQNMENLAGAEAAKAIPKVIEQQAGGSK